MRSLLRKRAAQVGVAVLIAGSLAAVAAAQPVGSPSASVSASAAAEASAAPTSSGSESAPASASASAAPAAPPGPPRLRGADVPTESSDKPKEAEWRDGKKVAFHRGVTERCELTLVREWLRVACKEMVGGGLVAGDPKGVTVWTSGSPFQEGIKTIVQFPLVRGTSRIVSFLAMEHLGYYGIFLDEAGSMSVVWRDGDADPVIGIYEPDMMDK